MPPVMRRIFLLYLSARMPIGVWSMALDRLKLL